MENKHGLGSSHDAHQCTSPVTMRQYSAMLATRAKKKNALARLLGGTCNSRRQLKESEMPQQKQQRRLAAAGAKAVTSGAIRTALASMHRGHEVVHDVLSGSGFVPSRSSSPNQGPHKRCHQSADCGQSS